jgi:hypothetical protein
VAARSGTATAFHGHGAAPSEDWNPVGGVGSRLFIIPSARKKGSLHDEGSQGTPMKVGSDGLPVRIGVERPAGASCRASLRGRRRHVVHGERVVKKRAVKNRIVKNM